MSDYVEDERVVSMKFDDKDFQRGARRTIDTLDKLEDKLSLKDVDKKSENILNKLLENVETIATKSYSIVDRAVDKIKDKITDGILNTINQSTIGQIDKGFTKFSEKTTSVGTLVAQGNSLEEVNRQLEKLNWFTDETSFNFTDMVSNIAKFTATGQSLEDAETAMMGIANWAALSGQNAQKASSAMYQLSQALGAGYMRKEDYKSIQNVSMDTDEFRQKAIEAAIAVGELRDNLNGTYTAIKTGREFTKESFADNLTEGQWFTKDVMMKVYKEYGSAVDKLRKIIDEGGFDTASEAIKEVEINNKRILKDYSSTFKKEGEELKKEIKRWSEFEEVTDEIIENFSKEYDVSTEKAEEALKDLSYYLDDFGIKAFKAAQEARTLADALDSIKDAVSTKMMNIFEYIFGDYYKAKALWTDFANWLWDLFAGKLDDLEGIFERWANELGGRDRLFRGIYGIFEAILNVVTAFRDLNDSEEESERKLNNLLSISGAIERVGAHIYRFVSELKQTDFFVNLYKTLKNIRTSIAQVISVAARGVLDIFPDLKSLPKVLETVSKWIRTLSEHLTVSDGVLGNIRKTLRGVASIAKAILNVLATVFDKVLLPAFEVVEGIARVALDTILEVTGTIGEFITQMLEGISGGKRFSEVIEELKGKFKELGVVGEWIVKIWNKYVKPVVSFIASSVYEVIELIGGLFGKKSNVKKSGLVEGFQKLADKISTAWNGFDGFKQSFEKFTNNPGIISFIQLLVDWFGNLTDAIYELFHSSGELSEDESMPWLLKIPLKIASVGAQIFAKLKWIYDEILKPLAMEIIGIFRGTVGQILEALKNGDIDRVIDIIDSIFSAGILLKIRKFVAALTEFLGSRGLTSVLSNFSRAFNAWASEMRTEALEHLSNTLWNLAKSIVLLTAAATVLKLVFEPKDILLIGGILLGMITAMGALVGILALLSIVMKRLTAKVFGVNLSIGGFGLAVLGLALAIGITTLSCRFFNAEAGLAITYLTAIILSFNLLAKSLAKSENFTNTAKAIGVMMAGLGAGLLMMVLAFNALELGDSFGGFVKKFLAMNLFMSMMVGLAWAVNKLADIKLSTGIAIAVTALAIFGTISKILLPMMLEMTDLSDDEWVSILKALVVFSAIMAAMAGSIFIMTKGANSFFKLITVGYAFKMMGDVIDEYIMPLMKKLSKNGKGWSQYLPGVVSLSALLLAIGGTASLIGNAIGGIIEEIKDLKFGQILGLIGGLGLIIVGIVKVFGDAISAMNGNSFGTNLANSILTVLSTVGMLTISLISVFRLLDELNESKIDMAKAKDIIMSITALLGVSILGLLAAVNVLSNTNGSTISAILYIVSVMAPLAALVIGLEHFLNELKKMSATMSIKKVEKLLESFMSTLTTLLIVIVSGVTIVTAVSALTDVWRMLAGIVAVTGTVIVVFKMMSQFLKTLLGLEVNDAYVKAVEKYIKSLSLVIGVVTVGVMAIVAELGILTKVLGENEMWSSLKASGLVLAATLASLFAVMAAFGKFNKLNLNQNAMKNALAITIIMGALTLTALAITNFSKEISISQGLGVAIVILAVAGAVWVLNKYATAIAGNVAIFKVIAIVAALGGALYALGAGLEKLGGFLGKTLNKGFTDEEKINSPSKIWAGYGGYLIKGLENGIKKEGKKLPAYMQMTAETLDDTFCGFMGIHSPSKVMYENGRYIVQGLIDGMGSPYEEKRLQNKSESMGQTIGDIVGASASDAITAGLEDAMSNFNIWGEDGSAEEFFKNFFDDDAKKGISDVVSDGIGSAVQNALSEKEEFEIVGLWHYDDGRVVEMTEKEAKKISSATQKSFTQGFTYEKTVKKLTSPIQKVGDWLKDTFGDILSSDSTIGSIVSKVWNAISGSEKIKALKDNVLGEEGLGGVLTTAGNNIKDKITSAVGDLLENEEIISKAKSIGEIVGGAIAEGVLLAAPRAIADIFTGTFELNSNTWDDYWNRKEQAKKSKIIYGATGETDLVYGGLQMVDRAYDIKNNPAFEGIEIPINGYAFEIKDHQFKIDFNNWIDKTFDDKAYEPVWNSLITNSSEFLKKGLIKEYEGFYIVGEELARAIQNGTLDQFLIKSPSRWMSGYVAPNLTKGLGIGLSDSIGYATDGIEKVCNGMSDTLMSEFDLMDKMASGEVISAPSIAPLNSDSWLYGLNGKTVSVDMSNINGAIRSFYGNKDENSDLINAINAAAIMSARAISDAEDKNVNVTITLSNPNLLQAVVDENNKYYTMHGQYAL